MLKNIETDRIVVTLRDDGIIQVHIKDRVTIDLECQEEMKTTYWKLTSIPRPFIFTAGEFISLTREAQKNAKTLEKDVPVAASALIVNNIAQKLMADFYYKLDPPNNPIKVFKNIDKGVVWIKSLSVYKDLKE
jgi:hypothetical protein